MLFVLSSVVGLAAFVCWILVLIKQFQNAGPLHGIIGIVSCGIWTLIWGWMNVEKLNIKNLMMAYTALVAVYLVLYVLTIGSMIGS